MLRVKRQRINKSPKVHPTSFPFQCGGFASSGYFVSARIGCFSVEMQRSSLSGRLEMSKCKSGEENWKLRVISKTKRTSRVEECSRAWYLVWDILCPSDIKFAFDLAWFLVIRPQLFPRLGRKLFISLLLYDCRVWTWSKRTGKVVYLPGDAYRSFT